MNNRTSNEYKQGIYARHIKRAMDFALSFMGLIILSPLLLLLTIIGAIVMKGNPFFVQERPGKNEKIFKLVKFRTMTNKKGKDGKLLPDTQRLTKYGGILRKTSIDEFPELINILLGQLSICGPRPLAVQYLPFYNDYERIRHTVRPGLTGLAQVKGRNAVNWDERFVYDVEYAQNITLMGDIKIIFLTALTVLKHENVGVRGVDAPVDFDVYRKKQWEETNVRKR